MYAERHYHIDDMLLQYIFNINTSAWQQIVLLVSFIDCIINITESNYFDDDTK